MRITNDCKNETNFAVEMAGIKIFSIIGNSEEVYQNEKLIFQSSTIQNKKEICKFNL